MGNFVANYLLPRALRIVRADPTFQFGNETTRNDSSVSDREWASTFPRKLAVFKTSSSGRSVRGVFRLSAYSLGMVLNASFVVAGDKMPFPHRFALLNFLDVLLVPFGSTLSTFTMAWGGNTAAHRPRREAPRHHADGTGVPLRALPLGTAPMPPGQAARIGGVGVRIHDGWAAQHVAERHRAAPWSAYAGRELEAAASRICRARLHDEPNACERLSLTRTSLRSADMGDFEA
jgi:hypothetical protein